MALVPIEVHSLADLDHVYRAFPRHAWAGKVLVYLVGDNAKLVSYGSRLRLTIDGIDPRDGGHGVTTFEATVVEMPEMRLPTGVAACAIIDRQPGMRFRDDGTMTVDQAALMDKETQEPRT